MIRQSEVDQFAGRRIDDLDAILHQVRSSPPLNTLGYLKTDIVRFFRMKALGKDLHRTFGKMLQDNSASVPVLAEQLKVIHRVVAYSFRVVNMAPSPSNALRNPIAVNLKRSTQVLQA